MSPVRKAPQGAGLAARKTSQCPQCQNVFVVERAETPASASIGGDASQWHVKTGEGDQYGPVTKAELDTWVKEGRLDSGCQVLKDGWPAWQWAEQVYPRLGGTTDPRPLTAQRNPPAPERAAKATPPHDEDEFRLAAVPTSSDNPFRSPRSQYFEADHSSAETAITPLTRQALKETKPWVTFLAVIGLLGGALVVIIGIVMLFRIGAVGIMQILMGVVNLMGAFFLLEYGQRLRDYLRDGSAGSLEKAIVAQKAFWRLVGILTAIIMVIYAVILLFAMLAIALST